MALEFYVNRPGSKCLSSGCAILLNFKTSPKNTRLLVLQMLVSSIAEDKKLNIRLTSLTTGHKCEVFYELGG